MSQVVQYLVIGYLLWNHSGWFYTTLNIRRDNRGQFRDDYLGVISSLWSHYNSEGVAPLHKTYEYEWMINNEHEMIKYKFSSK